MPKAAKKSGNGENHTPPGSSVDRTGQVHQAASSHKDKTLNQWKEEDIKNALDYWHNQDLVGLR